MARVLGEAAEIQQLFLLESLPLVSLQPITVIIGTNFIPSVRPNFSNLTVGRNYQIQVSGDLLNWTNRGTFTATAASMEWPQWWNLEAWTNSSLGIGEPFVPYYFFRIRTAR